MTFDFADFVHFVFIGFVALFPVVNPLGSSFIVSPYFSKLSHKEKRKAVKQVALNVFFLCLVTLLVGQWILELFGLSVPIIQLAGGIMICKIGWDFLSPAKQDNVSQPINIEENINREIENKLFYPITFPITAGAGVISVLITLSTHGSNKSINQYLINTSAIIIAIFGICILVYICYINADRLINYLGSQYEKIVNNIMAFLIFCVGLQIAYEGISQLIKPLTQATISVR